MKLTIRNSPKSQFVTVRDFPPNTLGKIHHWPDSFYNGSVVIKSNNILFNLSRSNHLNLPIDFGNDTNKAAIEILHPGIEVVLTQD